MSDYQQFLAERDKIDFLLQKGFRIKSVTENLSGAFVEFEKASEEETEIQVLHVLTAEARKYFSVVLMKQTNHLD
ncbi:hypothetical protein ACFSCX_07965 [Bacillus salitolerans]|uniref:Uncharacterized protein n=1 Tax=Bacillus salitolerans TaxID=1437434 RepID=A0ABW4LMV9_9BACI